RDPPQEGATALDLFVDLLAQPVGLNLGFLGHGVAAFTERQAARRRQVRRLGRRPSPRPWFYIAHLAGQVIEQTAAPRRRAPARPRTPKGHACVALCL